MIIKIQAVHTMVDEGMFYDVMKLYTYVTFVAIFVTKSILYTSRGIYITTNTQVGASKACTVVIIFYKNQISNVKNKQ